MHFLQKMKLGSAHLTHSPSSGAITRYTNRGVIGFLVNKAERWGGAWLLGRLRGAYRDKMVFWGQPLEKLAGIGLTGAAALLNVFTAGRSTLAPHVEALGDTAAVAWMYGKGIVAGHTAAGHPLPSWMGPNTAIGGDAPTVAGEIAPAAPGKYLTQDQLRSWTAPRGQRAAA